MTELVKVVYILRSTLCAYNCNSFFLHEDIFWLTILVLALFMLAVLV